MISLLGCFKLAGKDFVKKSSPVLFSKGSQCSTPFTVSIVRDSKPECPEKFRVKCIIRRKLRKRVKFLGSNVATVKITDNLSKFMCRALQIRVDGMMSYELVRIISINIDIQIYSLCFQVSKIHLLMPKLLEYRIYSEVFVHVLFCG